MIIGLVKILSTTKDRLQRLQAKVLHNGRVDNGTGDVTQPLQVSSFGFESNPTEGKIGLYVKSQTNGKYYVAGVINTKVLTEIGESRMFSTNGDGDLKFNIWLRNDGTGLIGTSGSPSDYDNFAVKFNELKTEFNKLKTDYNNLVAVVNANAALLGSHSHAVTGAVLASPPNPAIASPTGIPGQTGSVNTSNIDQAKNPKIKFCD